MEKTHHNSPNEGWTPESLKAFEQETKGTRWQRMNHEQREKSKAAGRAHYLRNRERVLKATKKYTRDNQEKVKQQSKLYYEKNKKKILVKNKNWALNNPESVYQANKRWQRTNKKKIAIQSAKRYAANPEKYKKRSRDAYPKRKIALKEYSKIYQKINAPMFAANTAERRAIQKQAMPPWVEKHAIRVIYEEAHRRGLTVDHIIPLKHPLICGLHVPWNLQFLSLEENVRKHNKFEVWS